MGLYAIPIHDGIDAAAIAKVLGAEGYKVSAEDSATDQSFPVLIAGRAPRRRPLKYWVTRNAPQRFCVAVGPNGAKIVRLLACHGVFFDRPEGPKK
jgi:hypothetical protein